jgi:TRAP-type C4-dicarboxylate transport system permease small subunit
MKLFETYRQFLVALGMVERWLITVLVFNIVLQIGAQVISRYLFDSPLIWVEDVATYSFIWATFLAASLGFKQERHVKIETFVSNLSIRRKALVRLLVHAVIAYAVVMLMVQAWTVIELESRRMTVSLPILLPVAWFFSVPLFTGLVSIALSLVYFIARELNTIIGANPLQPIFDSGANQDKFDDGV